MVMIELENDDGMMKAMAVNGVGRKTLWEFRI